MFDKIYCWLAWKLPKNLVKWCAVRLMTNASVGKHSSMVMSEITCIQALQAWTDTSLKIAATRRT